MREVESSDVRVEARTERVSRPRLRIARKELRARVGPHAEQVVALERWTRPRLLAVADARKQRRGGATEKAAGVHDCTVTAGVVARERVQQLALRLRKHCGNADGIRRQLDVAPRTAHEIPEW